MTPILTEVGHFILNTPTLTSVDIDPIEINYLESEGWKQTSNCHSISNDSQFCRPSWR